MSCEYHCQLSCLCWFCLSIFSDQIRPEVKKVTDEGSPNIFKALNFFKSFFPAFHFFENVCVSSSIIHQTRVRKRYCSILWSFVFSCHRLTFESSSISDQLAIFFCCCFVFFILADSRQAFPSHTLQYQTSVPAHHAQRARRRARTAFSHKQVST